MDNSNHNIDPALLAKFDRILDNTNATRVDFAAYRESNDARVNSLETKLSDCIARLEECERKCANTITTTQSLTNELDICDRELAKQQALKNNICISGIPVQSNENINSIVNSVLGALAVTISADDTQSSYRTKPRQNSNGLIIVKFPSFEKKLEVLSAKKKFKQLTLKDIKLGSSSVSVFISNQLTPFYSSLFYKAKLAISDGFFVSRWLCNKGVNVKTSDGTIHTVKSTADIDALTGASSNDLNASTESHVSSDSSVIVEADADTHQQAAVSAKQAVVKLTRIPNKPVAAKQPNDIIVKKRKADRVADLDIDDNQNDSKRGKQLPVKKTTKASKE